jgi:hypothetical protein
MNEVAGSDRAEVTDTTCAPEGDQPRLSGGLVSGFMQGIPCWARKLLVRLFKPYN